ncbi:hypothetical protein M9H77_35851 [Catharanthus roseus]|uniref:Uncharacterized protein n=1 Tax=Catharanthus roseus TaxID=4058 RepID=A0ACB9ZRG1_CATRO|nr:hypothetical protein M9H77_35851 [Catharanthus roseus]
MTPTGKNFTVATVSMRNEQATTYRLVLQDIKYLYFSSTVSTGNEQDGNAHELCVIITDRECGLMPVIKEGPISKARKMRRFAKGVLSSVLSKDLGMTLTSAPRFGPRLYCLCTCIQTVLLFIILTSQLILCFYRLIQLKMRDGCPLSPLHVQWEYHCNDRVSGWTEPYFDKIAYWNTRYARAYPLGNSIHVNL